MKLTNKQLKRIIKEELDEFGPQNMHPLRQKTGHEGPATFRGLVGSDVQSIEDDPNIPEDHKRKLIDLYQSGPEGKKQAIQLMSDMGYGIEPEFEIDSYDADSFKSNLPFQLPASAYKHQGMDTIEMRRHIRLENKLKITNDELKQIIKEEMEKVTK